MNFATLEKRAPGIATMFVSLAVIFVFLFFSSYFAGRLLPPLVAEIVSSTVSIALILVFIRSSTEPIHAALPTGKILCAAVMTGVFLAFIASLYRAGAGIEPNERWCESVALLSTASVRRVFLGPVAEELLFVNFVYAALRRPWSAGTRSMLVTAVVFAVLHAASTPVSYVSRAVYMMTSIRLFERTGSIIPCIVLHAIYNATIIVLVADNLPVCSAFFRASAHVSPGALLLIAGSLSAATIYPMARPAIKKGAAKPPLS